MWVAVIVASIGLCFAAFLRGAPYVPTHRRQITVALELLNLPRGSSVVDLGSGDGVFLRAAAKRGLRAYGYEINPILWALSVLLCLSYGDRITIFWRDFWRAPLPKDIEGVFIFASGPYMKRLARYLQALAQTQRHSLFVVSYGFAIPGKTPAITREGLTLYRFDP